MNTCSLIPSRHFINPLRLSAALVMGLAGAAAGAVTLNEVDSSTLQYAGNTEGFQFVELKGTPGESLNGHTVVFYNGATDLVYRVVSLDGYAIGASGYFVVGNPGVPNVDLVLPAVSAAAGSNTPPNDDTIQPGPDAVALYRNVGGAYDPTSFVTLGVPAVPKSVAAVGSDADEVRLDALLYDSFNVSTDLDLSAALAQPVQYHENANSRRLLESLQKNGLTWEAREPSPGAENFTGFPADGKLFVQVDDGDLTATEGDGPVAARVRLMNADGSARVAPAGGLTVTVKTTDFSEVALDTSPASGLKGELTVTIAAGDSVSADFTVVPQNDGHSDGTQVAFFTATASSTVAAHSCWLVLNDDGDAPATVTVNEINGRIPVGVDAQPGVDANGDAAVNAADQFIEIVNTSGSAVDLSGASLARNEVTLHTFPPCSVLQPGQSLLVFGSGAAVMEGVTAAFGNAVVQKAGAPLALGTHSAVRLMSGVTETAGAVFAPLEGGSSGAADGRYGSLWTETASDGATAYHAPYFFPGVPAGGTGFIYNAGGRWSTAGQNAAGAPLFPISADQVLTLTFTDTLTSTANTPCVPELYGMNAARLTIARPAGGPNTTAAAICIARSNSNALALPPALNTTPAATLPDGSDVYTIPAGVDSIDLFLHTTDATAGNGDNTFGVTVFSPIYRNASPQSTVVRDSGTVSLAMKCSSIVESAGFSAGGLTVTGGVANSGFIVRSEAVSGPLAAQLNGSVSGVAADTLDAGGGFFRGIDALNNAPVAARSVRFTFLSGPAGDCRNAVISLDVADDGGIFETGPFINEADTVQPSADEDDFVELTAPAAAGKSLSGWVLVVYGSAGTVASVHDLGGSTFAAGSDYFVLRDQASAPGVLNTGSDMWLPDAGGAVAIYRGTPADYPVGSAVTCRNLLDALVFNAANATLQNMLTPGYSFEAESGCIIARNPNASLVTDLRNTTAYDGFIQHRTPGFSNTDILGGYNAYAAHFPALAGSLPDDDTDGDGIKNLLEYFMGTNPAAFTPAVLPVISAGNISLTVDRGFDSACDPHVSLIGERSSDLILWNPMSASGTDPVIFTTPVAGPVLFTRLKATVVP